LAFLQRPIAHVSPPLTSTETPLVTVSIGLTSCADDASDHDGLFACADRRLYMAKSAGRNCVVSESGSGAGSPRLAWAGQLNQNRAALPYHRGAQLCAKALRALTKA
jgi:hypothetical protein